MKWGVVRRTLAASATLTALLTLPRPVHAQEIQPSYNTTNGTPVIRTTINKGEYFSFLDLFGDNNFEFRSFYGEIRQTFRLGNRLSIGVQLDAGSTTPDRIKPLLQYSLPVKEGYAAVRFAPLDNRGNQEVTLAGGKQLGRLFVSTWNDFRHNKGAWTVLGELEVRDRTGFFGRIEYARDGTGIHVGYTVRVK